MTAKSLPWKRICVLSSVHSALDTRIFYREARSLQQAGYQVTLIAVHDRDEVRDGVHIVALPRLPRWQRPVLWLLVVRRALSTKADVFHFHDPELLLVAPWLRRLSGRPTIYDVHEAYADFVMIKAYLPSWLRSPLASMLRWLEPRLAGLQSALIFADERIADSFRQIRLPKTTLLNYPDRSFVENAITETQEVGQRQPIILHLGGHECSRGIWLMVEAFHQVLQVMPQAGLLLVGPFIPPRLEGEVRTEIARRRLEHAVTIAGSVPFAQVGQYLLQASVGWIPLQPVPKYQKNIPTKVFEYMAYDIPIVSSDLAPLRPFVRDGENGYLVQADDAQAHAQAILNLLYHPDVARRMGRNGRKLALEHYTWDLMERRLLALYEQILHQPDTTSTTKAY